MNRATAARSARRSPEAVGLVMAFLLVVVFTFSADIVEFILDVTGHHGAAARPWLVFGLDCLLVAATAVLQWRISGTGSPAAFLRRLATGRWGLGAALVVASHAVLIATEEQRAGLGAVATVWVNLLSSAVFVAAMLLLLSSALGEYPAPRGWIIPLAVGTFVVQVGRVLWYPVIDVENGCGGDVSPEYFVLMTHILPVVLIALGIETNFVRRGVRARALVLRAAPVLTIILLSVALGLAFSMLVKAHLPDPCGLAAVWHEYISFVVTAQAMALGLATLVWLMLTDVSEHH